MTLIETDASEKSLHDRALFGHPKGLGFLSFTEACERFNYYSTQTLLVLYMVKYLLLPKRVGDIWRLHRAGLRHASHRRHRCGQIVRPSPDADQCHAL